MKEDYHFLVGQRFSVDGEIYVVHELAADAEQTWVEAHLPCAELRCADTACGHEVRDTRIFSLEDVINWLLVEEEIELFHPNYLAAR